MNPYNPMVLYPTGPLKFSSWVKSKEVSGNIYFYYWNINRFKNNQELKPQPPVHLNTPWSSYYSLVISVQDRFIQSCPKFTQMYWYIVACQQGGVSNKPSSLRTVTTHGPRILWSVNRWTKPDAKYLDRANLVPKFEKDGPYTGPVLLIQGEPGTSQYTSVFLPRMIQ